MAAPETTPNAVDLYVGLRVRNLRKSLKHSQDDLGQALGLTFQQIQKYERGANRISASKLFEMSCFLKVPVTYFFDGYPDAEGELLKLPGQDRVQRFLATGEGIELASSFPRIKAASHRRKILALVTALAEDADE